MRRVVAKFTSPSFAQGFSLSAKWLFGINLAGFALTTALNTETLVDLIGTGGIGVVALVMYRNAPRATPRTKALASMVAVWSARLSLFLFFRAMTHGDHRLQEFLKEPDEGWFDPSGAFFPVKLGAFWALQGVWGVTMLLPVTAALFGEAASKGKSKGRALRNAIGRIRGVDWALIGLFAAGLAIEVTADVHKMWFKSQPGNSDKLLTDGLYSIVQFPNYSGSIIAWSAMALYGALGVRGRYRALAMVSPVFLAFLLIFASGIPLSLDRRDKAYALSPWYWRYRESTPFLFPGIY